MYTVTAWTGGLLSALISVPLWFQTFLSIPYHLSDIGLHNIRIIPSLQTPFITGGEILWDVFIDHDFSKYLVRDQFFAVFIGVMTLINLSLWAANYFMGYYLNNRFAYEGFSKMKLLKDWILFGAFAWLIGLIEGLPILGAIKDYFFRKRVEWYVTPKVS